VLVVNLQFQNMSLRKDFMNIVAEFEDLVLSEVDEEKPADLLIYELGPDKESAFKILHASIQKGLAKEVFLVTEETDKDLLLQAIRLGAKEFLSMPFEIKEVQKALERYVDQNQHLIKQSKKGKLINIVGSKGGVGTTTIAVNLAVNLAEKQKSSVALIDSNMLFGEIPLFLGITPKHDWGEIIRNVSRMDKTLFSNILTRHSSGVDVYPSPRNMEELGTVVVKQVVRMFNKMREIYDFIIIDGGQSQNYLSTKALEISDQIILVAEQSLPCLSNTNKLLKAFSELGYPRDEQISVLINRYQKREGISLKEAENCIHKNVMWTVPNDYSTTLAAINQGLPLAEVASGASVTKKINKISSFLLNGDQKPQGGTSAWASIKQKVWGLKQQP
jgi:pilus assembly protein CpaE